MGVWPAAVEGLLAGARYPRLHGRLTQRLLYNEDETPMETKLKDDESYLENEIDLRKYFLVLVKRWQFIRDVVVVVVLATLLFGLTGAASVPAYEATAGVAIVKSKMQVNFEEKIKTISPDTAVSAAAAVAQDAGTRRNTLASLVQNLLVARDVIKNMGDRLPTSLRDPETLVRMVKGKVREGTDVVDVTVRGGDPAGLPDIANAWAVAFEHYVNRVYSGSGISLGSIDQDVATAKRKYEQARDALLQYNLQDRTFQLQRDLDYRKGVIDTLQKTRQAAITTILGKQAEVQTDFMGKYQSAALNMMGLPLIKEVDAKVSQLTALYANKLKIEQTLEDARTLRDQASRSPAGADSNSLALLLVKAQLATGGGLPGGLQLQVGAPSPGAGGSAAQVSDLDALISTLNSRLKEIQADIDRTSGELMRGGAIKVQDVGGLDSSTNPLVAQAQKMAGDLLQLQGMQGLLANVDADKGSPLTEAMDRMMMEVRQMGADLARENYTKTELTQNYTIAWQAYSTLLGKAQEVDIASQLPGSEVVFASPAVQPLMVAAVSRFTPLFMPLALAIALALLVGVVGVLAIEYISPGSPNVSIPWRSPVGRGWAIVGSLWRWVFRRPAAHKTEASDQANP